MSFNLVMSLEIPVNSPGEIDNELVLPGFSIKKNWPIKLKNQTFGLYQFINHSYKGVVIAHEIFIALRDHRKKPLHAGYIDYLLENQSIIPTEFQPWVVFFWGTIFEGSNRVMYAPCIYWDNRRQLWQVGTEPLHAGLGEHCLAACARQQN